MNISSPSELDSQGVCTFLLPEETHQCPNCDGVHDTQQYQARALVGDVIFSVSQVSDDSCCRVYGYRQHGGLSRVLDDPSTDSPFLEMIRANLEVSGASLVSDGGKLWYWDGHSLTEVDQPTLKNAIGKLRGPFDSIVADIKHRAANVSESEDEEEEGAGLMLKQLSKAIQRVDGSAGKSAIAKALKEEFKESGFNDSIDSNSSLLATSNCILELVSLRARRGILGDHIRTRVSCNYRGLGANTSIMDRFALLTCGGPEVARYFHKALGRGLLGNSTEQLLIIIWGGSGMACLVIGAHDPCTALMPCDVICG